MFGPAQRQQPLAGPENIEMIYKAKELPLASMIPLAPATSTELTMLNVRNLICTLSNIKDFKVFYCLNKQKRLQKLDSNCFSVVV